MVGQLPSFVESPEVLILVENVPVSCCLPEVTIAGMGW
jgi:hypothetical protein